MAILLDERARAAVERRRARGREATLYVRVELIPARDVTRILTASWAPRRWPPRPLAQRRVDDVVVYVDRRVAHYAQWHDVTISASWRLGPFEHLVVVDEPYVMLKLAQWVVTHPEMPVWGEQSAA